MNRNSALVLIDAQVNMFAEGGSVFEGEKLLETLKQLLVRARSARLTVVYVQNNGGEGDPDMPGTQGWQIHPALAPEAGDLIIQKHTPDSFLETNLQSLLAARQIKHLVIAGMQTEMCIEATCRQAQRLGYEVTLVKDAHGTFDGSKQTAAQIIARYNEELSEVATLEEAGSLRFE